MIHGGDFGSHEAVERVRDPNDDLTAVFGNADPADAQLPRVASADLGGLTVVVYRIVALVERAVTSSEGVVTGDDEWLDAIGGVARARAGANGVVGIGGHSHRTVDTTHDGVRVLNPGSATGAGPADRPTMLTVLRPQEDGLALAGRRPANDAHRTGTRRSAVGHGRRDLSPQIREGFCLRRG